ncbi:pyridoxamine 5'-phosphate oxidase [Psychroflexus gondwanensis]|jgi:pyridoxamine 5'-phosphate oxidase|uniref:Pyridoxine/pyridoxamine 5'-phosphate oxidase n=1 Tax=Psychroflexus gondwanensis ACAM 44 TaxID=1189619 RepID=N1X0S5_9FLAO|nr:pyridoxamine 5'-phosphate oxidase [Psychroflexus gondwanensis]EMY81653.1 pyridoxamine 5'-phosphate oxidase PdxH [Psychroflexus gondwanensis ACAM 44]TXE20769.1 pyridoxamine 5'-phosphate oxidase [Psychroflexus gondwanensis]
MDNNLHDYRKSYEKSSLDKENLNQNPLQQFRSWFHDVEKSGGLDEANAMTISTIGADDFPKNRIVLLKYYDENGFVFYTNYESEKGRALLRNPKTSLSFFWPNTERQVIIKGLAEKLPDHVSDNYFASRPKGSQLGALVSNQSKVIENREVLEKELKSLEDQYQNKEVPRPKNWGGFLVRPLSMEFWQGRPNRLHDRFRFTLIDDLDWKIERLAP